jgi:hypothetical IG protein
MKKIKVSFYSLGMIVKNLSVLLCIGMLSACNATDRQPKENDDTEVFFSDKKVKEEDEEYVGKTKKHSKAGQKKKINSKYEEEEGERVFVYSFKKSFSEGKSLYPNLSDYAAADIDPKEYIFPNSDIKLIDNELLDNSSLWQLRRGINEIYARRGRKFINSGQRVYFEGKSWYKGSIEAKDFEEDFLNEYEKNNVSLLQGKLIGIIEGINIGELELRVYDFLREEGANGVLKSKFNQNTLENILIKDIICQIYDESINYEKLRKEAEKISYYDADNDIAAIKSKDLDVLLVKLFGVGLNEINWNDSGVNYSKSENVYYVMYKDINKVDIVSVELIEMEESRYRFICRKKGYKKDNNFLIVELESKEGGFEFISVK